MRTVIRTAVRFDVYNSGIEGSFPLDLRNNSIIWMVWLQENRFTGPLPELPLNVTPHPEIHLQQNRWEGDIPDSWMSTLDLEVVDLSDCMMTGPLPRLPTSVTQLILPGNRFSGNVPDAWFNSTKLEKLDLSDNELFGPLFSWGWQGSAPSGNFDHRFLEFNKPSPSWPLKEIKLSDTHVPYSRY